MSLDDLSINDMFIVGGLKEATRDKEQMDYIYYCLERFFAGDFGEIPTEDIEANNRELEKSNGRIIAKYKPEAGLTDYFYIMAHFNEEQPEEEYNYTSIFYCIDY